MSTVKKIVSLALKFTDRPLWEYSRFRVSTFFYNIRVWLTSRQKTRALPIIIWCVAKDPFILLHLIILGIAPVYGVSAILLRLIREGLGASLFLLIVLPYAFLMRALSGTGRRGRNRSVALVTNSEIEVDIRIEKYQRSLLGRGFEVLVLGVSQTAHREEVERGGLRVVKVPFERHKLSTYWRSEQFFELIDSNCGIYHSNDLTSLAVCFVASSVSGAKLVFDAHEMWTENVEYDAAQRRYVGLPKWKKAVLEWFERTLARRADLFVTVNSEIAAEYQNRYQLVEPVLVVRNVPSRQVFDTQVPSKLDVLAIPDDAFLVGYIGGLGPSRNIEGVIRALPYCRENVHFQIMGPNASFWRPEYQSLAHELGVGERVHVTNGVPMNEVFSHMSNLDAGIVMLENLCMNFYLFLPNKIFEYMASGTPVLVSDFPVVKKLIDRSGSGLTFDPSSSESIATAITSMQDLTQEERFAMGIKGKELAYSELFWEREVESLLVRYDQMCVE